MLQTKLFLFFLMVNCIVVSHFFQALLSQVIVQLLHCDNFLKACAFLGRLNA